MKTNQYLKIVQKAKDCMAALPDRTSLNPQRVADEIIAKCDGDLSKVDAAFEAYGKQAVSTTDKPSIVQAVLSKRHA